MRDVVDVVAAKRQKTHPEAADMAEPARPPLPLGGMMPDDHSNQMRIIERRSISGLEDLMNALNTRTLLLSCPNPNQQRGKGGRRGRKPRVRQAEEELTKQHSPPPGHGYLN